MRLKRVARGSPKSKSNITSRSKNAGINLNKIKQNKGLSKLLVLAKRAKVRQEYLLEQQKVITSIQEAIDEAVISFALLMVPCACAANGTATLKDQSSTHRQFR